MAERKPSKAHPGPRKNAGKRQPPPQPARNTPAKAAPPSPLPAAVERLEARVNELKRERDTFEAELAAAKAKIAALEAARTDAINRIDWVLDSLHTVLQDNS